MKWDRWVGNFDGEPVFYIKHLVNLFGRRIDLHKMVKADADDCYHTHPANAFRIILKGGYVEEIYDRDEFSAIMKYKRWTPGMMGVVKPSFTHRIHRLLGNASYSLWFRGKVTHEIELIGAGWAKINNPLLGSKVNNNG